MLHDAGSVREHVIQYIIQNIIHIIIVQIKSAPVDLGPAAQFGNRNFCKMIFFQQF